MLTLSVALVTRRAAVKLPVAPGVKVMVISLPAAALAWAAVMLLALRLNLAALVPSRVRLVASGTRAEISAPEDLICADYVKTALLGRPRDRGEVLEALRRVPGAARFFDPANASWAPEQDFWLCAGIGRCPFVMRAEERLPSGEFVFRAVPVTA